MNVIEIDGVTKSYRRLRKPPQVAVKDFSLAVEPGGVFGFLGPNGSGKTTTIRLLLGLARADSGTLRLFGEPVPDRLASVISRVGSIVEHPLFFPNFTGRQNLTHLALISGLSARRVQEMLELVSLTGRADDPVHTYSLGMKQRLAIAAALLKGPELLILDEPGNGLDAAGIREVRELITQLGRSGVTVLLSSHQLAEVQQVCDRVAIMSRGSLLATGRVADLLAGSSSGDVHIRLAAPSDDAWNILHRNGFTVNEDGDRWRVSGVADPAALNRALAEGGHYLAELTPVRTDLETVFLQITGQEGAA